MTPAKARRTARLVIASGPEPRCVELGVFGGRGVIAMGLAVKYGLGCRGTVEGIDPFSAAASLEGTQVAENADWWGKVDYPMILQSAREGIARLGLNEIVRLILERSQDVVDAYPEQSIDVLHHDSNHSEEISCYEVATWSPKMKPGGFWVFDDVDWDSTKLAQSRLIAHHGFALLESHKSWAVFQAPKEAL